MTPTPPPPAANLASDPFGAPPEGEQVRVLRAALAELHSVTEPKADAEGCCRFCGSSSSLVEHHTGSCRWRMAVEFALTASLTAPAPVLPPPGDSEPPVTGYRAARGVAPALPGGGAELPEATVRRGRDTDDAPPLADDAGAWERLQQAAEAAGGGKWDSPLKDLGGVSSFQAVDFYFDHSFEIYPTGDESGPVAVVSSAARGAYIAAAHPAAVLALLTERARLEAEADKWVAEIERIVPLWDQERANWKRALGELADCRAALAAANERSGELRAEVARLQEELRVSGAWRLREYLDAATQREISLHEQLENEAREFTRLVEQRTNQYDDARVALKMLIDSIRVADWLQLDPAIRKAVDRVMSPTAALSPARAEGEA